MRCLALAQGWQDTGGRAVFAVAQDVPALRARLRAEGAEVAPIAAPPGGSQDAAETARLAQEAGAGWVVADGYHFGQGFQRAIKGANLRLLAIDDNAEAEHYYADIVLNQNLHAQEGLYACRESYTQLLLGPSYALLRREFRKGNGWSRNVPPVARRILVTMGGSDPKNVTLTVLRAVQGLRVDGLEAVVVVGGANPHDEALREAVRASSVPVRVERDAADMAALMAWADVAVAGAGSTCWELAFMGPPSILLVVADNQARNAAALEEVGAFVVLRAPQQEAGSIAEALEGLLASPGRRQEMAARAGRLVDGLGRQRVVSALSGEGTPASRHASRAAG